jgi:hypothetical protein
MQIYTLYPTNNTVHRRDGARTRINRWAIFTVFNRVSAFKSDPGKTTGVPHPLPFSRVCLRLLDTYWRVAHALKLLGDYGDLPVAGRQLGQV